MYPNRKLQEMSLQLFLQNRVASDIFWAVALWFLLCLGAFAMSWVNADNVRTENAAFEFVSALVHGTETVDPSPAQQLGVQLHEAYPTPEGQRAILELLKHVQSQVGGSKAGWTGMISANKEKVEQIFAGEQYVSQHVVTWGEFFWSVLTIGVPFLWPLFAFVSIVNLAEALGKEKQRFYDLPWHRRWMWWYAIATFPISTLFFIWSERKWRSIEIVDEARRKAEEERTEQERRTRVERIREQQEAERRAQAQVTDRMEAERRALRARTERTLQEARTEVQSIAVNALHERVTRERERLTRKISTIVREQNTERTLARWKKHRGVMTYHEQMQRVQSTARQIHEIEERLTVLGRKAAHQQERLADTEARHRQLNGHEVDVSVRGIRRRLEKIGRKIERTQRRLGEAQQANHALQQGVIQHTSVAEHVDDEWRRLLALPQVLCGSVAKDCIEIYTAPVIVTVQGERIDLGNYRVVVRPGQSGPAIRCTVSTRRDNGGHLYGSGNFCYGSRNEEMRAFIRRREYLSAIVLALEALHHMNENDENTARLHYLEVTDVLATTVP